MVNSIGSACCVCLCRGCLLPSHMYSNRCQGSLTPSVPATSGLSHIKSDRTAQRLGVERFAVARHSKTKSSKRGSGSWRSNTLLPDESIYRLLSLVVGHNSDLTYPATSNLIFSPHLHRHFPAIPPLYPTSSCGPTPNTKIMM
jgi:hypothetical protein